MPEGISAMVACEAPLLGKGCNTQFEPSQAFEQAKARAWMLYPSFHATYPDTSNVVTKDCHRTSMHSVWCWAKVVRSFHNCTLTGKLVFVLVGRLVILFRCHKIGCFCWQVHQRHGLLHCTCCTKFANFSTADISKRQPKLDVDPVASALWTLRLRWVPAEIV